MTEQRREFFTLLDQLRGIGALLVVYSHLVPNLLASRGRSWLPDHVVSVFIRDPLHAELNFGWPGVALFFFVSGFVVTHAAAGEGGSEYLVKRLLRIYPPLIVTALLVAVMAWCGTLVTGLTAAPGIKQVVLGASLGNYLIWAQPAVIAVGWTLVIEMFFYVGLWLTKPVLSRSPALVTVILLAGSGIIDLLHNRLGTTVGLASGFIAFIPVLLLGQVVYLLHTERIHRRAAVLLGCAAWALFVYGMRQTSPLFSSQHNSYLENTALMFCVFVIAVLCEGKLRPLRPLAFVAKRSYSLYLLHVPVGFTILTALVATAKLPYTVALAIALAAVAVATEIVYRLVERPSIRLARRLTARSRGVVPPGGVKSPVDRRGSRAERMAG